MRLVKRDMAVQKDYSAGDLVMTPSGPGRVKYVFGATRSGRREPVYAVSVSPRRPAMIFHQSELSRIYLGEVGFELSEGR